MDEQLELFAAPEAPLAYIVPCCDRCGLHGDPIPWREHSQQTSRAELDMNGAALFAVVAITAHQRRDCPATRGI